MRVPTPLLVVRTKDVFHSGFIHLPLFSHFSPPSFFARLLGSEGKSSYEKRRCQLKLERLLRVLFRSLDRRDTNDSKYTSPRAAPAKICFCHIVQPITKFCSSKSIPTLAFLLSFLAKCPFSRQVDDKKQRDKNKKTTFLKSQENRFHWVKSILDQVASKVALIDFSS